MDKILAFLLDHANAHPGAAGNAQKFYALKRLILRRAKPDGYDIQILEPQQCYACNGTGTFVGRGYRHTTHVTCYNCMGTGEYRPAKTVTLKRYQVGGKLFHVPGRQHDMSKLEYTNFVTSKTYDELQNIGSPFIHGRIKYPGRSLFWAHVFFALYLPGELWSFLWQTRGCSYSVRWNTPSNIFWNLVALIRHKWVRRYVLHLLKRALFPTKATQPTQHTQTSSSDELPF